MNGWGWSRSPAHRSPGPRGRRGGSALSETGAADAGLEKLWVHPQLEQRLLVEIAATSYWIESGLSQGGTRAEHLAERGAAWAQLLQKEEAVVDLRRALALAPDDNVARLNLAERRRGFPGDGRGLRRGPQTRRP